MSEEPTKNAPEKVHEFLTGTVKCEIYRYEGRNGPFLKAKIFTIYCADGKWHDSSYFGTWGDDTEKQGELEHLPEVATQARNWMLANKPEAQEAA